MQAFSQLNYRPVRSVSEAHFDNAFHRCGERVFELTAPIDKKIIRETDVTLSSAESESSSSPPHPRGDSIIAELP